MSTFEVLIPGKSELNTVHTAPNISSQFSDGVQFYIANKKCNEIPVFLNPEYESDVEIYENYPMHIPQAIFDMCVLIKECGGRALLVGGSVRDTVMAKELGTNNSPKDYDVEIYGLNANELIWILKPYCKRISAEGGAFQVYKVKLKADKDLKELDVSIPRRDSKTGPGSKGFAITGNASMSILEATKRRDITINGYAYDPLTQKLYDGCQGTLAVKEKRISMIDVGHFGEDPGRVLRIMQFIPRFGFKVDPETLASCREMVLRGDLDALPKERVTEEMKKLFTKGIKPSQGLEFAMQVGIIERYWPELHSLYGLMQELEWHPEGDVWTHTMQTIDAAAQIARREGLGEEKTLILCLAALCHDLGKAGHTQKCDDDRIRSFGHGEAGGPLAKELLTKFRFKNAVEKAVLALVPEHMNPKKYWKEAHKEPYIQNRVAKEMSRLHQRLITGGTSLQMLSWLCEADQRGRNGKSNEPLAPNEVNCLGKWQTWFEGYSPKVEQNIAGKTILSGREIMQHLNIKGHMTIIVGILLDAIRLETLEKEGLTKVEAFLLVENLFNTLKSEVIPNLIATKSEINDDYSAWQLLRNDPEDPRTYLHYSFS